MSMNKTRYGRKAVLDHFLNKSEYVFPSGGVWIALFTADPTETGSMANELSQSGYARVELSQYLGAADSTTGIITNTSDFSIGPAGEDWPEVTHMGIVTSATIGAGNMVYFGPLVTSRTVPENDAFLIKAGQLTIREK